MTNQISRHSDIKPTVLTPIQAANYLGIDTKTDALKASRSTGMLWGVKAPEFIKAGSKKILYRVSVLDKWLEQFQSYSNNAQAKASLEKDHIEAVGGR